MEGRQIIVNIFSFIAISVACILIIYLLIQYIKDKKENKNIKNILEYINKKSENKEIKSQLEDCLRLMKQNNAK